jgi:DNA-binding NarL/FixJ family response regulator
MKINIIIADDHKLVCQSLASLIRTFHFVDEVFVTYNGKEAIDLIEKHRIGLVILDVRMPEMNGLLASKHILKHFPEVKVINITMFDDEAIILDLYRTGVHGIFLKGTESSDGLHAALIDVMNGTRCYSPEIQQLLSINSHQSTHPSRLNFTPRELQVLGLTSEGKSAKEISSVMGISVGSIENYRKKLLKKSKTKNVAELLSFCIKNGVL